MRSKSPRSPCRVVRQATHDDSASLCIELTSSHPEIKERLSPIRRYRKANKRMTQLQSAEVLGHGLSTLKQWIKLLETGGFTNLVKRSTRPHNMRAWEKRTFELVALITELRNEHFARGREKIYPHMRNLGLDVSETNIGRIFSELLCESKMKPIKAAKYQVVQDERDVKKPKGKHAVREKPEPDEEAGDRIEADTLDVPLTAGVKVYIMMNTLDKVTR